MENDKRNSYLAIGNGVLTALIVIMTIIFIAVTMSTVYEFLQIDAMGHRENSFYYAMESKRYDNLLDYYYTNLSEGYGEKSSFKEYYAVAKYYEAALFYKAFDNVGDEERAGAQMTRMIQAASEMGEFSAVQEEINDSLGFAP